MLMMIRRTVVVSTIAQLSQVTLKLTSHNNIAQSYLHLNSQRYSSTSGSSTSYNDNNDDATSFQPPLPPKSNGLSIFPDVVMREASGESSSRNMDKDAVFVVTGASRGIGFALVQALLKHTKGKIVACCRSPDDFALGSTNTRVTALKLDLEDQSTIDKLGVHIENNYKRVDGLFNVAAILGDGQTTPGPERSLAMLDRAWIEKGLAINVIGPVMLVKALAPLMKTRIPTRKQKTEGAVLRDKSIVVNISARVGSVSDNGLGGWYSYRFSKTALNQATRTMGHELKRQGTYAVAIHPGTTKTDLSGPFHKNVKEGSLFPVEFTAKQILTLVDSMDDKVGLPYNTGTFSSLEMSSFYFYFFMNE